MVKKTITITTIVLILFMILSLIIILNKTSLAADNDIARGTSGTCSWVIDANGVFTISPTDGVSGTLESYSGQSSNPGTPWNNYRDNVKKVVIEQGVKTNTKANSLFAYMINCTEMNLLELDTRNTEYLTYMFYGCSNLEELDLSSFNTESAKGFGSLFRECSNLTTLDISSFDTRNVTTMYNMFKSCDKLKSVKLGQNFSFKGNNITIADQQAILPTPSSTPPYMGKWIREDELYGPYTRQELTNNYNGQEMYGTWVWQRRHEDIASGTSGTCSWVIDCEGILRISPTDGVSGQLASYTATNLALNDIKRQSGVPWIKNNSYDITKVFFEEGVQLGNSCNYLFYGLENCTEIDMANINSVSNVTSMEDMFGSCTKVSNLDVANWDVSNVTSLDNIFYRCTSLTSLDVSSWDTRNTINMGRMFNNCTGLTSLDVSNFNTSNVTNMSGMFSNCCELTSLNVSNFNTSNVSDMKSMFSGCSGLTTLDVSNFDTSNVTDISSMFSGCNKIEELDIDDWDTSNVTTFSSLFRCCEKLKTLDINNWDTSKVISLFEFAFQCKELVNIDLNNWDTSKVGDTRCAFEYCSKLESLNISSWDTSNVNQMDEMFANCSKLKNIDLSQWNTSNVKRMKGVFAFCYELESLDLSNWDTRNVTSFYTYYNGVTYRLFYRCNSLNQIVLGEYFDFDGDNITDVDHKAIFPETQSPEFTDRWLREDGAYGPYSRSQLRDNYDGSLMAGTWIRERAKFTVTYKSTSPTPSGASAWPRTDTYVAGEEVTIAPNPTAPGYTFSGWSRTGTFEMPAENVVITGGFTANTDTPYKVEHYLEDLTEGNYTLTKTDNMTGTTAIEITAAAKDFDGFTFDDSIDGTELSGTIAGDGSLVLKLYYRRKSYNVSYSYTGDVPDDASSLPQSEIYKYGATIHLLEEATAEGYTFSGWISDYITMPAHDIEITGHFIEKAKSYSYKVEYYFDNEIDDSLEKILNAEKDEEISITPQTPVKHGGKNYTLVSNNHQIIISISEEDNIIQVYYESDVLDYEYELPEGDGIPDKYQIVITYKVENGKWDDGTNGTKTNIITLYDSSGNLSEEGTGSVNIPKAGNKPNEGYTTGSWNKKLLIRKQMI